MIHRIVIELTDELGGYEEELEHLELVYGAEELPQDEWVPVSKELPNKNGWYICTCEGICNRTVGVVGYDAIQKKWGRGGVIAWQPLPEPYKQG